MKTVATLVGCAIGDALGNPFEMKSANSPALKHWDGLFKAGGTFWHGEAGQYTDDTLMSIALAASLLENNGFDAEKVAAEYLRWYDTGNTRGIGATTATAMMNLKIGATWEESGLTSDQCAGNGTAMRASPIGLYYRDDINKLVEVAMLDASITHNNFEPKIASVAVAFGTAYLVDKKQKLFTDDTTTYSLIYDLMNALPESVVTQRLKLAAHHIEEASDSFEALADIGVSGFAPESVAAAFYCLAATSNFKDCVTLAVRAGGDTDTTAAIAGALAGTYYGLEGISDEYKSVENFQLLQDLTDDLLLG